MTVTGQIYPAKTNATVRVTFVRSDLSWVDLFTTVDASGRFNVIYKLDTYGYWAIYAIHDDTADRLSVNVISPSNSSPASTPYDLAYPSPQPSLLVIAGGLLIIVGGALAVGTFVRDKKGK